MMLPARRVLLISVVVAVSVIGRAQQYEDYDYQDYANDYESQDNLYQEYAERQQRKAGGGDVAGGVGVGGGLGRLIVCSALSWIAGAKFHTQRETKKLKNKFQKEQKQLYTQYYNDVYKLSEQNQELTQYIEQLSDTLKQTEAKHELEAIQRDYDEFKQPDIDGDERISRAEFNMYVKNYLSNYPGLTEKDYPKFEDFDHDGDGYVSFQEYSQQMALQAQQAEAEQLYGDGTGGQQKSQKAEAMQGLYQNTQMGRV